MRQEKDATDFIQEDAVDHSMNLAKAVSYLHFIQDLLEAKWGLDRDKKAILSAQEADAISWMICDVCDTIRDIEDDGAVYRSDVVCQDLDAIERARYIEKDPARMGAVRELAKLRLATIEAQRPRA